MSDPYAKIAFEQASQITRCIKQTVCPDWDQTLIYEDLEMYGNPKLVSESPPNVTIEVYDKDQVVSTNLHYSHLLSFCPNLRMRRGTV